MQKIGIAGLGTVGAEVARQILKHHDSLFEITCVCARDRNKDRDLSLSSSVVWCDTPSDMVDHCDVIIELMGGTGDHVANLVGKAINQNKAVITANKAYLAENLNLVDHELIKFEAAVAGGIPIIETMK
jgi:homoserine dehydrogenase